MWWSITDILELFEITTNHTREPTLLIKCPNNQVRIRINDRGIIYSNHSRVGQYVVPRRRLNSILAHASMHKSNNCPASTRSCRLPLEYQHILATTLWIANRKRAVCVKHIHPIADVNRYILRILVC